MINTYHSLFPFQKGCYRFDSSILFRHTPLKGNPQVCLEFILYFDPFLCISCFLIAATIKNSDDSSYNHAPHTLKHDELNVCWFSIWKNKTKNFSSLFQVSGIWLSHICNWRGWIVSRQPSSMKHPSIIDKTFQRHTLF